MNMLARYSLLLFTLFVSGFSLGFAPAIADELPEDTNKIESLTPEQAQKLAREFPGMKVDIEVKGAGVLSKFGLPLSGLKSLDAETAKELAGYGKALLVLNGLTKLDAAAAKSLAGFKGATLLLDGLTTLDADTAKALTLFEGEGLSLTGLTTLDAETAKALAEFKGEVALPEKVLQVFFAENPLTPETALAWAVVSRGNLSHVTALDSPNSVAIAQALATRKGPLSLPNLKKISPKTLSALIEKEDVEIPLIETLELIPEPDGSPNDDFVIPEWLEKQQHQKPVNRARG